MWLNVASDLCKPVQKQCQKCECICVLPSVHCSESCITTHVCILQFLLKSGLLLSCFNQLILWLCEMHTSDFSHDALASGLVWRYKNETHCHTCHHQLLNTFSELILSSHIRIPSQLRCVHCFQAFISWFVDIYFHAPVMVMETGWCLLAGRVNYTQYISLKD